jgi:mRNA interferase HicA
MKRKELIKYLTSMDCYLQREGGNHSWWINPYENKRTSVPRHNEINDILVQKICKDLGIPVKK